MRFEDSMRKKFRISVLNLKQKRERWKPYFNMNNFINYVQGTHPTYIVMSYLFSIFLKIICIKCQHP